MDAEVQQQLQAYQVLLNASKQNPAKGLRDIVSLAASHDLPCNSCTGCIHMLSAHIWGACTHKSLTL